MPPKFKFFHDGRETALHTYITSLDPSTLKNNPAAVLAAIDDYNNAKNWMMIFQQPKVDVARRVLESMEPKPRVLVELGGYVGKSAIAWGEMLRSFQSDNSAGAGTEAAKVFSLELEGDFVKITRDFVELAGLSETVGVVQGQSSDSLRALKEERGIEKIDVLFLDHWEEFYLSDLRLCEELGLLKVGSVIVADNTDMPGAPEYLKYMQGGGEGGWKYRCETVVADVPEKQPRDVHFAFVEQTP